MICRLRFSPRLLDIAGSLCGSLMLWSCHDPSFVSLGKNDEAVLAFGSGDAGLPCPACEAAATGEECTDWPESVQLSSGCDERREVRCPELGEAPQETLDAVLSSLLRECGESVNQVRVHFVEGCATRFALLENASQRALAARVCIAERLRGESHSCARELRCGTGRLFSVPTSSVEPEWY